MAKIQGFSLADDSNASLAKAIGMIAAGLWMNSSVVRGNLGTGTPSSSTFLRGDGTWAATPEAFPVGSIFISAVSTDPATLLGYGTWSAIGAGRVLIGLDSGDANFDTLGETGGAKTVTSAGSVAAPTISGSTASEGSHTHSVTSNVAVGAHSFTQPTIAWPAGVPTAANESSHTHTFTDSATAATPDLFRADATGTGVAGAGTTGAGSAHTHVLSWPAGVPTASGGAVDAHSVANNAVTSGAGSSHSHGAGTLAASAPAFTGSATSVVQPYLVVKFWQRTA